MMLAEARAVREEYRTSVLRLLVTVCDKQLAVSQRQSASCQLHLRLAKTREGAKDSMTRARSLGCSHVVVDEFHHLKIEK
jgi:hypothetical protein